MGVGEQSLLIHTPTHIHHRYIWVVYVVVLNTRLINYKSGRIHTIHLRQKGFAGYLFKWLTMILVLVLSERFV